MGADIYQVSFSLCRSLFNLIFEYNAAAHFSVNTNTKHHHFYIWHFLLIAHLNGFLINLGKSVLLIFLWFRFSDNNRDWKP
jgi:hypothetical protein